jgi:sucrose-phosphate synthase
LFVLHLALGGCLKASPVLFGITSDTGGHIAYVLHAAAAQAALPGHRVTIVTRLFHAPTLGGAHAMPMERLDNGVVIERIATPTPTYLDKEALAAELPAFAAAFCEKLATLPRLPDLIHAHFADAAFVALQARRRFGIPMVFTPHALGIDKRAQGLGSRSLDARIAAERRAIREADAIIVSTRDEAGRQLAAYDAHPTGIVARIPPGVSRQAQARHEPGLADHLGQWLDEPGRPIVLAIARAVRKKNLASLLRAFAGTPDLAARANLVILAGQQGAHASAEERAVVEELHRLRVEHGLQGRVALPARHAPADVGALYHRAAQGGVFANPAFHEPFGLTLIEAASAGVPVVATREGGAAEILSTIGHGLAVDPRDDAAIGQALLRIVRDEALHRRLARAARCGVGAYDWARYAERSADLYAALCHAAAAREAWPALGAVLRPSEAMPEDVS